MTIDQNVNPSNSLSSGQQPIFAMVAQYVKDLSFENPKIIQNIVNPQDTPHIDIDVQVQANRLNEEHFEVALLITAKARREEETEFLIELTYGGIFFVSQQIPESDGKPLLLIEAPRLLFPFARQVIATLTQNGGLPPLLLQPLDFNNLYAQQSS